MAPYVSQYWPHSPAEHGSRCYAEKMTDSDWEHVAVAYDMSIRYHARIILEGKQVFWMDDNMFGFTTEGVRPGDMVCVFGGSRTLHVIRRVVEGYGDGVERWRFVGDAYVYGLMHGEADDTDVEETQFCMV